ncbi:hypothetical protein CHUAL_010982 [Chamberlinius hualienensis]
MASSDTSTPNSTFEDLHFDNLALRTLPIDQNDAIYSRNVSGACFSRVKLSPLDNPVMVSWSRSAATLLGLPESQMNRKEAALYLSGSKLIPGTEPAAHCYCGHQFGYFAGQLGDGAAMYLGELINEQKESWEIQLKGSGLTPYSRTADGRKVLRSSIREFLCSEAMFHLGIPTTRALSCVTSDSMIERDIFYNGNSIMERCTVVCRVAPSFIRFGSFEIFKKLEPLTGRVGPSVGRVDILQQLLDYVISKFYQEIYETFNDENKEQMYAEFYKVIVKRTARLVSQWQSVGFCHGVLNTDNMSILGLTIDYGPFGFMDYFNPEYICNASDDGGRYSYLNQPNICEWNLHKLAEALEPVLPLTISEEILKNTFSAEFNVNYLNVMRKKLGLTKTLDEDRELVTEFLTTMETTGADFTNSFRILSKLSLPGCDKFEESIEDVKNTLVGFSCSSNDLRSMHRPMMEDSHFRMYVTLLSQHPEVLSQLGKGAEALKREIERREKFEHLSKLTDEEKRSQDENSWAKWINKYVIRLKLEVTSEGKAERLNMERVKIMNSTNPRFILRNYIAQIAIEAAENGDFTEIDKLLRILEKPYDDSDTIYDQLTEKMKTVEVHEGTVENCSSKAQHSVNCFDAPPPSWARALRVT